MFLKCEGSCSFTVLSSGTTVPAQYGTLCCFFAPTVPVFWLATSCVPTVNRFSQYSSFLLYIKGFLGNGSTMAMYHSDFFLNQRSDLGGVSNTRATQKNLALYSLCVVLVVMYSLCVVLVVMQLFILYVNMRGFESFRFKNYYYHVVLNFLFKSKIHSTTIR